MGSVGIHCSEKTSLLYEGKAKSLYHTQDDNYLIIEYRDDMTAFNGEKFASLPNKGVINNCFNTFFMTALHEAGVPTHFVRQLNDTEVLVKSMSMLPIESVIRNRAAGSLCRRLGVESLQVLKPALQEFFLKDDALGDPLIGETHILHFGWADQIHLDAMKHWTLKINEVLTALCDAAGLLLVDAKFEFGLREGEVVLSDEISPDSCRILDRSTLRSLDKDVFRQGEGDVLLAYIELARRLGITLPAACS